MHRICSRYSIIGSSFLSSKLHIFLYLLSEVGMYLRNVKRNLLATRTRSRFLLPLLVRFLFTEVPLIVTSIDSLKLITNSTGNRISYFWIPNSGLKCLWKDCIVMPHWNVKLHCVQKITCHKPSNLVTEEISQNRT